MAFTTIAVTKASTYLFGENPTATAGDAANDHDVHMTHSPVCLIAVNSNVATVDFSVYLVDGPRNYTDNAVGKHRYQTIPAAAGGVNGVRVVWLDLPGSFYPMVDGLPYLSIYSADANFGDVRFYAVTGIPSPR